MRYRYSDYPVDLLRALLTYQELVKLFLQLVLQTGGDVEEALKWLKYLQERGIIDPGIDLEQFRKELQKNEIVAVPIVDAVANPKYVDPNGEMVATARSLGVSFGDGS